MLQEYKGKKIFCLELASLLYELAFQIYYGKSNLIHNDSLASPNLDSKEYSPTKSSFGVLDENRIKRLGFVLHTFVTDPGTDSHAMIFLSEERRKIVVAFRGTASMINLTTDLNSVTIPYCNLLSFERIVSILMTFRFKLYVVIF